MNRFARWIILALALVAFVAPLKFGTPVVLESLATPPVGWVEWLFFSWPNQLGLLLVFGTLTWFVADRRREAPRVDFLVGLPILFLVTQALALPAAINTVTAVATVLHFAACVLLFYAAAWYVRDGAAVERIFVGLGLATFLVCIFAMEQWWGGLEATRALASRLNEQADGSLPPDLLARLQSQRVFGTLVYPNALAGYLVVAFTPMLAWIWVRSRAWDRGVRWLTLVLVGGVMLFCLVLTGSRGGFLALAAALAIAAWWCFGRQRRAWVVAVVLLLAAVFGGGLASGRIHLGESSLGARLDYWQGAVKIIREHPWQGSGPGTFGSIYPMYKQGTTEEAQLVHNNYLQIWSDSGVLAFVLFGLLWVVALRDVRRLVRDRPGDAAAIAVGSSLVGWVVHGLVDFDLYVPGVAFPAFILLGALQGLKADGRPQPPTPSAGAVRWGRLAVVLVLGAVLWLEGRSFVAAWYHGRAQRLVAVNNLHAAAADLDRALRLAPRNSHYLSTRADLAGRLGNPQEAREFYRRAIENDPYRPAYHWRLAKLLGPTPEGLLEMRRAAELNPSHQEYQSARQRLEEIHRHLGADLIQSEVDGSPEP